MVLELVSLIPVNIIEWKNCRKDKRNEELEMRDLEVLEGLVCPLTTLYNLCTAI